MPTYFQINVQTYDCDDNPKTSCSCSRATLASALTEGCELASYYHLSCAYPRVTIEVVETCNACYGRGTIANPRTHKQKTCRECKGKPSPCHIGPFDFRIHDNARHDLQLA